MKGKKGGKKAKSVFAEIKSITAWNIFVFLVMLMVIFLVIRYLLLKFVLRVPEECGVFYYSFRTLTSCPGNIVSGIKFYDLSSYFIVYIKHGGLIKYFYFLIVPIGVYLLLTRFMWKKPSTFLRINSLIIGILLAIIIYLLFPSSYLC